MNRWLQGRDVPITRIADKPLDVKQLRVFDELPADQKNTTAHEWFVAKAEPPAPPRDRAEWDARREKWLNDLRGRSFRSWPQEPPPLDAKCIAEREAEGLRLRIVDFTSDENLRLPIYVLSGSKHAQPSLLLVTVVDDDGWKAWLSETGAAFGDIVPGSDSVTLDRDALQSTARMLDKFDWALATLPPRGVGPNQWNPDKRKDTHIRRRFILLGKTADDGRVWDLTRSVAALRGEDSHKAARLWLQGRGVSAGIALYAGGTIVGADPFTGAAYRQRTGRTAEPISFEDIAAGTLAGRRFTLVVCSFALHLVEPSRLPTVAYELSRVSDSLLILTPHKRPALKPAWGWTLVGELVVERVRARLYGTPQFQTPNAGSP